MRAWIIDPEKPKWILTDKQFQLIKNYYEKYHNVIFSASHYNAEYFYQIKIYHFSSTEQENVIDTYLEKAYLPAMHRAGIEHIGVFKPVASTEGKKPNEKLIYVLIPFSSQKEFSKIDSKLAKDQQFQSAGAKYLNAPYTNPPFYGEVVSGPTMPNLMYMTTFENKADRDAHWDKFRSDPYWKELSSLPQYQNNVSKNVTLFLYPTDYSDIW